MAALDKRYSAAFKAGAIGAALVLIFGALAFYMYERDQYNYWHSDASHNVDNFCVGVFWIPFFLFCVIAITAFTGELSVKIAGNTVTSVRDALVVSGLAGFILWCIDTVLLAFLGSFWRLFNHTEGTFIGDLVTVLNIGIPLVLCLIAQVILSAAGGITRMLSKKK